MGVEIQALWFRVDLWTKSAAEQWLYEHKFKNDDYAFREDAEENPTHHIFRQFDPGDPNIIADSWATLSDDFPEGVTASTCARREKAFMDQIQKTGHQSEENPMTFAMATEHVDRMGDIIKMDGAQLAEFKRNPIALYGHNHEKPIGTWKNLRIEGKKLLGDLKLAAEGTSAEIDTIRKLVQQRILRAVSVGFIPKEAEPIKKTGGYMFKKWSLNECSLVAVPANPQALAIAKSLGADRNLIFDVRAERKARIEASIARIEKHLES